MAAAIIAGLPKGSLMLAGQPSMAGAGFINVRLSPAWVAQRIQAMLTQVHALHFLFCSLNCLMGREGAA